MAGSLRTHHRASSSPATPLFPSGRTTASHRDLGNATTPAADLRPVHPTLLQPRLAVVLNVPSPWHPWLFASRLLSILPAVWWGLPTALQLLLRLLPGHDIVIILNGQGLDKRQDVEVRYALMEAALATIWVCWSLSYRIRDDGYGNNIQF